MSYSLFFLLSGEIFDFPTGLFITFSPFNAWAEMTKTRVEEEEEEEKEELEEDVVIEGERGPAVEREEVEEGED